MESGTTFMFIDESGDLGKLGPRYFIIAALCTTDPKPIFNAMKRIREMRLKKRLRVLSELKANNSDDNVRFAVLDRLMRCQCEFHILKVDKTQVRGYLFGNKNKLYNYLAGILFEHAQGSNSKIHLIIDKKDRKSVLREDLSNYLSTFKSKISLEVDVEHIESHNNAGLQAVDFIAWSAHRKFNLEDGRVNCERPPPVSHDVAVALR
ncbi:MAG: DUF3800 domain-containing protein, partial [Nanoarchaeota archaeon]